MRIDKMETSLTLRKRLRGIRLLAMDVDGVLTDGLVSYDSEGRELKSFHVSDGLGIVLLRRCDIKIAWISGRKSAIVEKRGRELCVDALLQGVYNKRLALEDACFLLDIPQDAVAYVGDDWNDLPAFAFAGVCIAVANAVEEVKAAADIITQKSGGKGAVREVCNSILEAQQIRQTCLESYLASLTGERKEGEAGQGLSDLLGQ